MKMKKVRREERRGRERGRGKDIQINNEDNKDYHNLIANTNNNDNNICIVCDDR